MWTPLLLSAAVVGLVWASRKPALEEDLVEPPAGTKARVGDRVEVLIKDLAPSMIAELKLTVPAQTEGMLLRVESENSELLQGPFIGFTRPGNVQMLRIPIENQRIKRSIVSRVLGPL